LLRPDPFAFSHHGDSAEDTFHPKIASICEDKTCDEAKSCIRSFANSYSGGGVGRLGRIVTVFRIR
jgi:hypothetical protein